MTENLDDEEAALVAQLAAVRQRKAQEAAKLLEEKRLAELTKPITVSVSFAADNTDKLIVRLNEYRANLVDIVRTVPGRLYSSQAAVNSIPISEWKSLKQLLQAQPNVTIIETENLQEKINKILFAPNFEINKELRYLTVVTNARAQTHGLRDIPGTEYDYRLNAYVVPLTEAWRLWNFTTQLDASQTVIYSPAAAEFTAKQVEARMLLDKIALAKDWEIEVPGLKINLKPFQKVGTAYFGLNGGSGILADEMGLGKSAQFIARSLVLAAERLAAAESQVKILLIVPASLKINWIREIAKFTNEKSYTLSGTTPTVYDTALLLSRECPRFIIINYDILGANTVINKDYVDDDGIKHIKRETKFPWVEVLNLVNFDLIGYDEGHYIKNSDSNRSQAARKLVGKDTIFLTGTPVLNRPGELWPMLNVLQPHVFPTFERFVNQYTLDGKTTRNVEELREVLKPLMIRRLKKDVYEELPPLNRIIENHELSPRAKKLYERCLEGVYEVIAAYNPSQAGDSQKISNILVQIQRLKQIAAIDKVPATADLATRIFDSSDPSERPKKVLIFTQFRGTAFALKNRLGNEAIGFVSRAKNGEFVTANASEQDKLVQDFQNDPNIHFLVVTEKTAKEGHNITQAMAVIFNDLFWTPAAHQQSEGRAYMRNNDPNGIDAYYHVATETIDEWIQALLAAKLQIIEEVVDGVQGSRVVPDESIVSELIQMIREGKWSR